jgi:hypothetical protein
VRRYPTLLELDRMSRGKLLQFGTRKALAKNPLRLVKRKIAIETSPLRTAPLAKTRAIGSDRGL